MRHVWLQMRQALGLLALVSFSAFGQQSVTVTIQEYRYQPNEVRIKAGDTVKWVNRENAPATRFCSPPKVASSQSDFSPMKVGNDALISQAAIRFIVVRIPK